jgi:peptidyl-prolyl cis-trans isomerase C
MWPRCNDRSEEEIRTMKRRNVVMALGLVLALVLASCTEKAPAPAEKGVKEAAAKAEQPVSKAAKPVSEVKPEAPVMDVVVPKEPEVTEAETAKRKREELLSPEAPDGSEAVVAWSGEQRIYTAEFESYVRRLPPAQRREYSSLEKKQEMLRNLITFNTLASKAVESGLDKDPDVLLAMKTEMVKKYLQQQFGEGANVAVDDAAVEARYKEQFRRYNKPARVRASHILIAEEREAGRILKELKKEIAVPGNSTRKVFREFVRKYSEDVGTSERGGDLLFFAEDGTRDGAQALDPVVAAAVFTMQNVNQVSSVVKGESGYHILLITNRRDEVKKSFEVVREPIRESLEREGKDVMRREFMAGLVDFEQWHIESRLLDEVPVDAMPDGTEMKARMESIRKVTDPNAPPKAEPK